MEESIRKQLMDAASDEALILIDEGYDPDMFIISIDEYEVDKHGNLTEYEVTIIKDVVYH